ncbi:DUF4386 domain-containing protein [Lysinibacillus sp. NPDC094403]|uniref:DUF4386 domain-containing protein n=1 Tax=Lysinibacillus sp. NPDC094403 TaxID=3390581 RepID=UPI003D0641F2
MNTTINGHSNRRKSALIGGTALIIMALAAFFSYGFVHENLVLHENASATFNNLKSSIRLFKAEIFGWIIILITDIIVTWAFYIFLEPINRSLALLAAWLRLTYTTILGIAILNLVFVLLLSNGTNNLTFNIDQLQAHTMLFLEAFETIWAIDLIIFGGHLLVISYIAFKSSEIPKVISILLLIAAIGYIIINLCITFFSQYDVIISILKLIFNVPMVLGELGFGIWLLIRGGKVSKAASS